MPFAFRLTFGVGLAMRLIASPTVSAGFFRVNLWVLLGINTFAALVLYGEVTGEDQNYAYGFAAISLNVVLLATCYLGSVCWLYQWRRVGKMALTFIVVSAIAAAILTMPQHFHSGFQIVLGLLDVISSGFVLGSMLSAMLLGHWYLNTPSMELAPLNRLVLFILSATVLRVLVCGTGSVLLILDSSISTLGATWLAFRWLAGLIGPLTIAWFTRLTLRVPNTQSATGLLYAGVIVTFMGELIAAMVSAESQYPV